MPVIALDDAADPRLDDVRGLTDVPHRRRYERRHDVLVAEGPKVVATLLTSPYRTRFVVATPARAEAVVATTPDDVPVYVVPPRVLADVVGFRLSRGVVAAADRTPRPDHAVRLTAARRVVVLEATNDADNVGGAFRTCRALGVDGVLLVGGCSDPLYRRSVRVSLGHVLHVPFAWVDTVDGAIGAVRAAGLGVFALTPARSAMAVGLVPVPPRIALLVGAEGPGLTRDALAAADRRIRIPMAPGVDSLNVVVALGIALDALERGAGPHG